LYVKDEKKVEKKAEPNVLEALANKLLPSFDFSKVLAKVGLKRKAGPKSFTQFQLDNLLEAAGKQVKKDLSYVYFIAKKSFGMLAELAMIK